MGQTETWRVGRGPPIDRGWAWMIVFATLLGGFCMVGIAKSFGIVADELKDYFDAPQYMVSLIFGVSGLVYTFAAPLALILGEQFSQRTVVIIGGCVGCAGMALGGLCLSLPYVICTFGLFFGIGNGFLYGNCLVMIGKYFKKRRSLANGIALTGGSIGQFALPPLIQFLIDKYTIKGALLLLGGIYFHITAMGALLRPLSLYNLENKETGLENGEPILTKATDLTMDGKNFSEEKRESDLADVAEKTKDDVENGPWNSEEQTASLVEIPNDIQNKELPKDKSCCRSNCKVPRFLDLSVLKNRNCLLYSFAMFFIFFGYFNLILFLPTIALERHVELYEKAYLVSISGICDLFGRLLFGFVSDFNIVQRYKILAWCSMIVGVDILMFVWSQLYWQMAIQSGIYGFFGGGYVTLVSLVLIDFVGLELFPRAFTAVLFLQGTGAALGQVFLGWVRDVSGDFRVVIIICAVTAFVGGVSLFLYPFVQRLEVRRNAHKQKHADVTKDL